jgi:hypothetical protein
MLKVADSSRQATIGVTDGANMKAMRPFNPLQRRTPGRKRRLGVLAGAAKLLGVPVQAVVPVQRLQPRLVLAMALAELAAVAVLIASASLAAFVALVVLSLALLLVSAANRHLLIAFTSQGNVALSTSRKGWPRAVVGPLPRHVDLPQPEGLGGPVQLDGATWWVDRSAFRFLRHAQAVRQRELLEADGEDHGGEGEDHGDHHGDAVEVALDDRGPRRRRPEAAAEHLREPAAAPAVQQDQHDEGEGHHHMDHEQEDGHGRSLGDEMGQAAR